MISKQSDDIGGEGQSAVVSRSISKRKAPIFNPGKNETISSMSPTEEKADTSEISIVVNKDVVTNSVKVR